MATPFTNAFKRLIAGGVKYGRYGVYDTSGLICGSAGTLANGSGSGFGRWYGVKSVDLSIPDPERQTQTGDDKVQGSLFFESADPVTLAIQMGVWDQDVEVGLLGTKIETIDNLYSSLIAPSLDDTPLLMLLFGVTAKSKATGSSGRTKGYLNWLFTECQLRSGGPDGIKERTFENYDYSGFANPVTTNPWGTALSVATNGSLYGVGVPLVTANPLNIHNFIGDGSTTTVTLDETPAAASANDIKIWKNVSGTVTKLTYTTDYTVNTSTKVVTLVAAPAAGAHLFIMYEHL